MSFCEQYRLPAGQAVNLADHDPGETSMLADKKAARKVRKKNIEALQDLQFLLYAENKRSLLVVIQAMDAGGKDGLIRKVFGPLNPQGCRVTSFKAPNAEELAHDFLWRIHKAVPEKGMIGVFNRSHYEDVLIVRVHDLVSKAVWQGRYQQINEFENVLTQNGVTILKLFLHISKDEQLRRLQNRLDDPTRHWKADPADFAERKHWDKYITAYQTAMTECNTDQAPWFVVPADNKWYRNVVVSGILRESLEKLDMKYPEPRFDVSKIVVE